MSVPLVDKGLTPFQTELKNLTQDGILGGYLVVEGDGSLKKVGMLRIFWENCREFFGYTNHANANEVQIRVLSYLSKHANEINDSAEMVIALAKKANIISFSKDQKAPSQEECIQLIINKALEKNSNPSLLNLTSKKVSKVKSHEKLQEFQIFKVALEDIPKVTEHSKEINEENKDSENEMNLDPVIPESKAMQNFDSASSTGVSTTKGLKAICLSDDSEKGWNFRSIAATTFVIFASIAFTYLRYNTSVASTESTDPKSTESTDPNNIDANAKNTFPITQGIDTNKVLTFGATEIPYDVSALNQTIFSRSILPPLQTEESVEPQMKHTETPITLPKEDSKNEQEVLEARNGRVVDGEDLPEFSDQDGVRLREFLLKEHKEYYMQAAKSSENQLSLDDIIEWHIREAKGAVENCNKLINNFKNFKKRTTSYYIKGEMGLNGEMNRLNTELAFSKYIQNVNRQVDDEKKIISSPGIIEFLTKNRFIFALSEKDYTVDKLIQDPALDPAFEHPLKEYLGSDEIKFTENDLGKYFIGSMEGYTGVSGAYEPYLIQRQYEEAVKYAPELSQFYHEKGIETGEELLVFSEKHTENLRQYLLQNYRRDYEKTTGYFTVSVVIDEQKLQNDIEKTKKMVEILNQGIIKNIGLWKEKKKHIDIHRKAKGHKAPGNIGDVRALIVTSRQLQGLLDTRLMDFLIKEKFVFTKKDDPSRWFFSDQHKTAWIQC
jgi:hypothetical protein